MTTASKYAILPALYQLKIIYANFVFTWAIGRSWGR